MTKFNKILKGLVAGLSVAVLAGVSVNAQDTTQLSLSVTAGQLTVDSPATAALSAITISGSNQTTSANINNINVVDLRGTNAGYSLTMKVQNLSLATPDPNDNILMATATNNIISGNAAMLTITNSGLADNSTGNTSAPVADLALTANPVFNTMTSLSNGGETAPMTILVAEANEGAGDYRFNTNIQITIPAYGNYGLPNKKIGGGNYTGTIFYNFL
jgi:hypothetical protein